MSVVRNNDQKGKEKEDFFVFAPYYSLILQRKKEGRRKTEDIGRKTNGFKSKVPSQKSQVLSQILNFEILNL